MIGTYLVSICYGLVPAAIIMFGWLIVRRDYGASRDYGAKGVGESSVKTTQTRNRQPRSEQSGDGR
ncbi:hypothetical protein BKA07_001972 [Brevibacterium marinum]|uniref:Uncharacterized protein n=1 Tax=Brevibacterium marinum TaxID=418643 RepID=A0A846S7Z0_9MICO|nr:hypothetical protein [Brevibacterium marinum]